MLTKEQEKDIEQWVKDLGIDETQLDSYHWERNPYGVEDPLIGSSSCYEWDEEEYYEAQQQKALDLLDGDRITDYMDWDIGDDIDEDQLTDEAIKFIEEM